LPDDFASAIPAAIEPSGDACVPLPVPPATTKTPKASAVMHGSTLGSSVLERHWLLQR
jgi:hypothetical protein